MTARPHFLRVTQALALATTVAACSAADQDTNASRDPQIDQTPTNQADASSAHPSPALARVAAPNGSSEPVVDASLDVHPHLSGPIVPGELPSTFV
jgi:hypothetical protein